MVHVMSVYLSVLAKFLVTMKHDVVFLYPPSLGARQSSGEGLVRRNSRPKGCFWRVRFLSAPLRFACVLRANLKGGREETDSSKPPFWTTISPHDTFAAPLARSRASA